MRLGGIIERPKLTVESTPPIALATAEKPPAEKENHAHYDDIAVTYATYKSVHLFIYAALAHNKS